MLIGIRNQIRLLAEITFFQGRFAAQRNGFQVAATIKRHAIYPTVHQLPHIISYPCHYQYPRAHQNHPRKYIHSLRMKLSVRHIFPPLLNMLWPLLSIIQIYECTCQMIPCIFLYIAMAFIASDIVKLMRRTSSSIFFGVTNISAISSSRRLHAIWYLCFSVNSLMILRP